MAPMRATRLAVASACLLVSGTFLAACGGSGGGESGGGSGGSAESRPAPAKSEFPATEGRTLHELVEETEAKSSELLVTPAARVFYEGGNRYPFGVFKKGGGKAVRKQVNDAEVALYMAKMPTTPKPGAKSNRGSKSKSSSKGSQAKATETALNEPALGPFPAKIESLQVRPAFQSKPSPNGPEPATVVYSSQISFPSEGDWRIAALIKEGGEYSVSWLATAAEVGEFKSVPRRGEKPPVIHTPTAAEVGGDLSKITTRIPPDTQNQVDYAEVIGKEPIMLLFATPQFCQSRVCGPVVDVAEEAKKRYGDKAAFIHMEIYNENDPSKGVRPQVRAFHLPSEPWLFAINREGVVSSTVEGAFGKELMDETVEKVISE